MESKETLEREAPAHASKKRPSNIESRNFIIIILIILGLIIIGGAIYKFLSPMFGAS